MKRYPVRGQAAKWCICGEWFASERDEREHAGKCPGPQYADTSSWPLTEEGERLLRATDPTPAEPR